MAGTATVAKKARPKPAAKTASASKTKATATKAAPAKKRAVTTVKPASNKVAPTRKAAPAKAKVEHTPRPRVMDEYGFVVGSDSSIIAETLLEGGKDRNEVNAKCIARITKANGINTRGGNPKNIPSLVSGILSRMEEQGFKTESSWTLVAPVKGARKPAAKTASKAAAAPAKAATAKAPAKARPAKKVAAKRAPRKAATAQK